MSTEDAGLPELLAIARQAARLAGDVIMPLYRSALAVELKADRTPVTAADRGAEEAMRAFFARETPRFGVLGEEFGETPGDGRHRWIVDPIDGTKSFIHHVPLFGTLVALERDGAPVVGVIACHAVGETAYAARGLGAELDGVPIRVSTVAALEESAVLLTGFAPQESGMEPAARERSWGALQRLCASGALLRTWGDCFGYLSVAVGRAEAMLDPQMSIWDAAALYPVITEAGGTMTTFGGEDRVGESVLASNGRVHGALLRLLSGAE